MSAASMRKRKAEAEHKNYSSCSGESESGDGRWKQLCCNVKQNHNDTRRKDRKLYSLEESGKKIG